MRQPNPRPASLHVLSFVAVHTGLIAGLPSRMTWPPRSRTTSAVTSVRIAPAVTIATGERHACLWLPKTLGLPPPPRLWEPLPPPVLFRVNIGISKLPHLFAQKCGARRFAA